MARHAWDATNERAEGGFVFKCRNCPTRRTIKKNAPTVHLYSFNGGEFRQYGGTVKAPPCEAVPAEVKA